MVIPSHVIHHESLDWLEYLTYDGTRVARPVSEGLTLLMNAEGDTLVGFRVEQVSSGFDTVAIENLKLVLKVIGDGIIRPALIAKYGPERELTAEEKQMFDLVMTKLIAEAHG